MELPPGLDCHLCLMEFVDKSIMDTSLIVGTSTNFIDLIQLWLNGMEHYFIAHR